MAMDIKVFSLSLSLLLSLVLETLLSFTTMLTWLWGRIYGRGTEIVKGTTLEINSKAPVKPWVEDTAWLYPPLPWVRPYARPAVGEEPA